jgi:hypothetical protein
MKRRKDVGKRRRNHGLLIKEETENFMAQCSIKGKAEREE